MWGGGFPRNTGVGAVAPTEGDYIPITAQQSKSLTVALEQMQGGLKSRTKGVNKGVLT